MYEHETKESRISLQRSDRKFCSEELGFPEATCFI